MKIPPLNERFSPFAGYDVVDWLNSLAERRGDHPMIIWAPHEGPLVTWSYRRFVHDVACVAGGLAHRGIKKGDRVLVHLENCPEMIIARFACAWLGAICVGTNALAAGPEIGYFAENSGAVGGITQPKFADAVDANCRNLKWLAVTETDAGVTPTSYTVPRSEAFQRLMAEPLPRRAPDAYLASSIMFTTGTTSRPKGVVWTHANMLWGGKVNAMQQGMRSDDVSLIFLPLYHVAGLSWNFFSTMWVGGTIVMQSKFSASRYWPLSLETRATIGSHVGFSLNAIGSMDVPKHFYRQWIMTRIEPEAQKKFGVDYLAGWGMTEVLTQAIVCDLNMTPPPLAIGRAGIGYQVRIVDEDGRDVERGGAGALLLGGVRGHSIFREYDGDEKATAEAFDENGYFRTGDRVYLRENGWIEFSDRIKDVIKVGGEGVSAAEIEMVISQIPGVAAVAVVAKPNPQYGEVPVAFVVMKPEIAEAAQAATRESMTNLCREQLAKFKVPREVIFVKELPRVGFGKISKAQLRAQFFGVLPQAKAKAS
jgi:crotonobetaine/carnitine-CoA ligase